RAAARAVGRGGGGGGGDRGGGGGAVAVIGGATRGARPWSGREAAAFRRARVDPTSKFNGGLAPDSRGPLRTRPPADLFPFECPFHHLCTVASVSSPVPPPSRRPRPRRPGTLPAPRAPLTTPHRCSGLRNQGRRARACRRRASAGGPRRR
ncbi:MAG: hypothetical protein J3K34DRAFT_406931, partial [Monoraphidium minutum]